MEVWRVGVRMKIIDGKKFCDDRGFVSYINDLDLSKYKRFYIVENHEQGFIRAWHGHKLESKAIICLRGAALITAVEFSSSGFDPDGEVCIDRITISAHGPQAVIIPAGFANGAKTLTPDCILMYLSDKTVEESKKDDYRFPWHHWGTGCWGTEYK